MTTPDAVFGLLTSLDCRNRISSVAVHRRRTGLALPGGKVLPGETPEAALLRKFAAETGIKTLEIIEVLHEAVVDGQRVRTYAVDDVRAAEATTSEWATPDDLLESQARMDLRMYNLRVLLAGSVKLSDIGETAWTVTLGSGTLQYSRHGGSAFKELYLHERCAFELGPQWDTAIVSRLTRGRPIAMPDEHAWTEALWFARQAPLAGPMCLRGADLTPEWVTISDDGVVWEGLAIVAEPRGLAWWPAGRVAVAKLSQWQGGRFV